MESDVNHSVEHMPMFASSVRGHLIPCRRTVMTGTLVPNFMKANILSSFTHVVEQFDHLITLIGAVPWLNFGSHGGCTRESWKNKTGTNSK